MQIPRNKTWRAFQMQGMWIYAYSHIHLVHEGDHEGKHGLKIQELNSKIINKF